ncbi:MAG: methyl-accepting chemotaxis protein [Treponema sp.]|jgi:methyl-accepting chemotaxis protein|nr:methyl-accepting chemotaxis protein [Treponema sp.]
MKLKLKLGIIVMGILFTMVLLVSIILVTRAWRMQTQSVTESIKRLGSATSNDLRRRYETYLQIAIDLATVFGNFEDTLPERRRDNVVGSMKSMVKLEQNIFGIYTCWYPDALDGNDAAYRRDTTSTETGQFIPWVTRRNGELELAGFRDGYREALAELSDLQVIKDPVKRNADGRDILVYDIRVPVKNDLGVLIGLVGVQVSLEPTTDYIQSQVSSDKKTSDIVTMQVISNNGTVVAHSTREKVGRNAVDADKALFGEDGEMALASIRDGKFFALRPYSPLYKSRLYLAFTPFFIGKNPNAWSLMVGCAENRVFAEIKRMSGFAGGVAFFSIFFAASIIFMITGRVTDPLVKVSQTLRDISEGERDLTRSISVTSKDEIGDLAHYFNKTLEKIKILIITIKQQAMILFNIGNELASNMTETTAAINEITASIQNIKGRVVNQGASVSEANATMEQITVNIDKLNENVEQQSSSVSKSSNAIEEMIANIQSVSNTLTRNAGNVKGLREASSMGRSGLQEVSADIQEIAKESEGLLEINAVMENIASQTNLLSMNAAIEAAHAGEAGKGFAVVADEIRKLAEDSGEQSKTISAVLKKIKDSIDKISRSTDEVLNRFEVIDGGVKTVSEQAENIRSAMEEQSAGSQRILEVISQLNEITRQVQGGSDEMLEGSKEVIREEQNLEKATQEITNGMNEIATGANQINIAVNRVNEISGQNKNNINLLVAEVSKFKVE